MKKVILINGLKRSGKDYTAELISKFLDNDGTTYDIFSFADPMKTILTKTLNITLDEFNSFKNNLSNLEVQDCNGEKHLLNFRELIQNFGDEAMKPIFGNNVWVDLMIKNIEQTGADVILIPDFRFPQEYLKSSENISVHTINVFNEDILNDDKHASENSLDGFQFDYHIDNTGQPDITQDVELIISEILG